MKNLTWQNPEQLFVAQELINKVKSKCCGIKDYYLCTQKGLIMENKINYLKNPMGFLFSDEEMGLRTNADREDVVSTFAGIEADIVNGIMNAGNKYLQYAEENPIARREHNFAMVNLHGLIT